MKNLLFLFVLNVTFFSAQTYDFDYLISYSFESVPSCKGEIAMYVSTKNENYELRLTKRDGVMRARLIDYQYRKSHYFIVNETWQKAEVLFDFKYDYSTDTNYFNPSKGFKNEYSLAKDYVILDSGVENLELRIYKNSRKKKIESKFSIEFKKSENLFSAFQHCCIHPHKFTNEENLKNILVTKATETTKKGQLINYELKTLKEVNFQLIVPKEPKN